MEQNCSKKVLMVCDSLGGGGAERQLALLASKISAPWQAAVFSLGEGVYADKLREAGVPLTVAPRRFRADLLPFVKLWQTISKTKPTIVHSWGYMSCLGAEFYCRPHRIPHVAGVIRRGSIFSWRGMLPKIASRLGDLALGNSQAGLAAFKVPGGRGRVLYNGFSPDRLARVSCGDQPESSFHLVMAATMDDRKDFPTFLAAVRRLHAILPCSVRATALGGGPNLDSWRATVPDLIKDGTVRFPGRVDEVLDYLTDAHVGVLLAAPGWGEGISNSIMEYMAARLPVVCTDAGGNPELVIDGSTGILIPPGDVDALVTSLVYLAENRDRAKEMGRAGRRRIETAFSVQAMVVNAIRIYEEAIVRKGGA